MSEKIKCCMCGKEFVGWGNNPWPVVKDEEARCCDACDAIVLMARIRAMQNRGKEN